LRYLPFSHKTKYKNVFIDKARSTRAIIGVDYIRGVDIIDRAVRSRRVDRSGSLISTKWARKENVTK
jgi:hypothetical protein